MARLLTRRLRNELKRYAVRLPIRYHSYGSLHKRPEPFGPQPTHNENPGCVASPPYFLLMAVQTEMIYF
jgi:hypothetical protein